MQFIPMIAKMNFPHYYSSLPCHMNHDPPEIISICWFAPQEIRIYY